MMMQVMQLARMSGADFKSVFYAMAQQKGEDPNVIIAQTQNMLK